MKVKFTIQERNNLHELVGSPQLQTARYSIGDVKKALDLIDKLNYTGNKKDLETVTELTLTDWDIKTIHERATQFNGWPAKQWVVELHEKLEQYKKEVEQ